MIRRIGILVMSMVILGCGGGDSTSPENAGEDDTSEASDLPPGFPSSLPTEFEIHVSSGLTPTISWTSTGNARVRIMMIFDVSKGLDVPSTESPAALSGSFEPGVASPWKYGTTPVGDDCIKYAPYCHILPLKKDKVYYIQMTLQNGKTGQKLFQT